MLPSKKRMTPRARRDYWERVAAVFAVITVAAAWIIGSIQFRPAEPDCQLDVLPGATHCRPIENGLFEGVALDDAGQESLIGWAAVASASGYGGPVQVMVGVSPDGEILGVTVTQHSESPSFFDRVDDPAFLGTFSGMEASAPLTIDQDVDAVTRATTSSRAVAEAVRQASYTVVEEQLGLTPPRETEPIRFGIPEITIIALFVAGYIGHRRGFRHKKLLRWSTMLVGMIVLGFIFNSPLTIGHFNSLLLGFWPDWRANLYWFLLIGGILFVVTADGKNPYCSWFCPFGATQECLGAIGGAKYLRPRHGQAALKWTQRGLAWSAVVIALLLRNPGLSSYEIFGTLFAFSGSGVQWIILSIILLMSLFVRRPWCNFLCPVDPIVDLINAVRRWIRELWQKTTGKLGQ